MLPVFSVIAAAAALNAPQTAVATRSPVTVNTCAVGDLINPALMAEFGQPISFRLLRLTFTNTDDTQATQVAFDVAHDGTHTIVTDRGRFSKGVAIEHLFDDFTSTFGDGVSGCSVASITFADGRRWTAN